VARTTLDEAAGLTAGELIHGRFDALPDSATVADVRAYFELHPHRRMAFLAGAGERYAGSLVRADVDGADDRRPAIELARQGPTVLPDAPADAARELALMTDARRVPVVDRDGRLLGVVAVTEDRAGYCGTKPEPEPGATTAGR
jgi:CBS domain-containing protein